ncbi:hypothetical protein RND81_03G230100 [Saponaria officinalis]|uniref:Uncharacterized protein n=1 Tax=Saponaria officinalis TaxID=3572 RepID=A0AAW1M9S5_SAPOF
MPKRVEAEGTVRVRKGHFVVYVGSEMKRYVIPTYFLKNAIFQQLLEKAEDEFGFDNHEKIILPCDEHTFNELIAVVTRTRRRSS